MPLDKMADPDAATSDQRSTARTGHENGLGEALLDVLAEGLISIIGATGHR
jgi:hypothetical protein